ncbi:unnamed protein product [Rhizophagus irregularis]|uniref:Uncharacterized protein n=1 Tax=Rhizophagus irregularis TaxID=588596 RepID=A0A915Z092_9GLOM|nr:unnamed protein product [Rhizophagus irregularis]CAB5357340.1 unnamed protein product [Rhizophagus irregularis]
MLEDIISEWIGCINDYYIFNRDGNRIFEVPNIDKKLKNDMLEFVKADKALTQAEANLTQKEANLTQEKVNTSIIQQTYSTSSTSSKIFSQEVFQEIDDDFKPID